MCIMQWTGNINSRLDLIQTYAEAWMIMFQESKNSGRMYLGTVILECKYPQAVHIKDLLHFRKHELILVTCSKLELLSSAYLPTLKGLQT